MAVAPVRAVARGADREPGRRLRAGSHPQVPQLPSRLAGRQGTGNLFRRGIPRRNQPGRIGCRADRPDRHGDLSRRRHARRIAPHLGRGTRPGGLVCTAWSGPTPRRSPPAYAHPARNRTPGAGRPGGSPTLSASARTGRSADRAPDRGAGRPAVRGSPCRAAAVPVPRRRLRSSSPAARRRRREALTSASCVRTSACSRAHARRCRASGPANRSADGTARMARRCQEPCGAVRS